ncbi:MAG: hydroxyisourate hydrolase, partial [Pseudomonadota bacterium]
MAGLTTHVLDTSVGRPAAGVVVRLFADDDRVLAEARTNADGRCDAPLLGPDDMQAGRYRLEFSVGDYFRANGAGGAEPSFLDVVPIAFGIAEPQAHYHVPLLISPFGYST